MLFSKTSLVCNQTILTIIENLTIDPLSLFLLSPSLDQLLGGN